MALWAFWCIWQGVTLSAWCRLSGVGLFSGGLVCCLLVFSGGIFSGLVFWCLVIMLVYHIGIIHEKDESTLNGSSFLFAYSHYIILFYKDNFLTPNFALGFATGFTFLSVIGVSSFTTSFFFGVSTGVFVFTLFGFTFDINLLDLL